MLSSHGFSSAAKRESAKEQEPRLLHLMRMPPAHDSLAMPRHSFWRPRDEIYFTSTLILWLFIHTVALVLLLLWGEGEGSKSKLPDFSFGATD